jgi:CheY-like chemotaxis protein
LIADSDTSACATLRLLLEQHGYTCAVAGNGLEALEVAIHRAPRFVLLNFVTAEQEGLRIVRQLRADPRTRWAHIHCLTALADTASQDQAHEAGFELLMNKPVDAQLLLKVAHQQVNRPQQNRVIVSTKTQAEDLLDWIENHGGTDTQVAYHESEGFVVRWRWPIARQQRR